MNGASLALPLGILSGVSTMTFQSLVWLAVTAFLYGLFGGIGFFLAKNIAIKLHWTS